MKATWANHKLTSHSLVASVIHKTRFLYFFFGETCYDFFARCPGWISHFKMNKIWSAYTTALATCIFIEKDQLM